MNALKMSAIFFYISILWVLPAKAEWIVQRIVSEKGDLIEVQGAKPTEIKISGETLVKRNIQEYISETAIQKTNRFYQDLIV